jgi:hypothetical protein
MNIRKISLKLPLTSDGHSDNLKYFKNDLINIVWMDYRLHDDALSSTSLVTSRRMIRQGDKCQ